MTKDRYPEDSAEDLLYLQRDLAISLSAMRSLPDALRTILQYSIRISGIDCGGIYLVDHKSGTISLAAHDGLPEAFVKLAAHYDFSDSQGQMILQGRPLYGRFQDLTPSRQEAVFNENLRAIAIIPIFHQNNVIAALNLASHRYEEFADPIRGAIEAIAAQVGGVIMRMRAEEAIRSHEQNLQALFNAVDDFLFIFNTEGRLLHYNPVVEQQLGYSPDELHNIHVLELHPEARRGEAERILKGMISGNVHICPVPLISRSGRHIPVETRVTKGRWAGQEVLFGISRDISRREKAEHELLELKNNLEELVIKRTSQLDAINEQLRREMAERKKTRKALEDSENMLKAVLRQSSDILSILDLQGKIVFNSEVALQIHGFSNEELAEKGFLSFIHPLDRKRVTDGIAWLLKHPENSITIEYRHLTKKGPYIWMESVGSNQINNPAIAGLLVNSRDITERKLAEKEIRDSEERYRKLVEISPDSISLTDTNGRFVMVNPRTVDMYGFSSSDEMIGLDSINFVVPEDRTRHREVISENLAEGTPRYCELTHIRKDGSRFPVEIAGTMLHGSDGQVIGFISVVRDISERKKLEEEMIRTEKLESVGVLAGGIAHDFNNLLTGIIGNISLARMYTSNEQKLLERLTEAEKASSRAKGLTQQLLTFSKGGMPVKKVISIKKLIEETSRFTLSGSNVKCVCQYADPLWNIKADEGQINQVIHNLVLNADQAMPLGGLITIRVDNFVHTSSTSPPIEKGNYIRFSITDQGSGIDREHLQHIFDPYFTTKDKGSGLGLSTTYSIIKKHKGHIEVRSTPGQGSRFDIYLPACTELLPDNDDADNSVTRFSGKILLMDDELLIREFGHKILTEAGFSVDCAENGEQAVFMYRQEMDQGSPYDAVIIDLTVPGGMGGMQAMEELRLINPDIRAIVSSGYSNDPVMSEFEKHGFKDVLVKPYRNQDLLQVLRKVVPESVVNS